jgi:dienelactone hydrolase
VSHSILTTIVCSIASLLLGACAAAISSPTLAPTVLTATSTSVPTQTSVQPAATPAPTAAAPTPQQPPLTYANALPRFQYDSTAPFDLKVTSEKTQDGMTIRDVSYAAANRQFAANAGGRIAAYIVTPPGSGPFAGILFMHGLGQGWGNRQEFLDEAVSLAQQGVVSVLPGGMFPWMVTTAGTGPEDQTNIIDQVIELRRAVDLLLAQPGVDPQRIAYVGHDYGAMHGAVLAGVEKRIKAYVLMAGDSNYSNWAIKYFAYPSDEDLYRKQMAAVDPVSYLPHAAPAALYFQFGKLDSFVTKDAANQQTAAASQPQKVDWYDAGHTLNDQAKSDRLAWLEAQLGLKPAIK